MKSLVSPWRSISAKIFGVVGFLVALTVVALTLKNSFDLQKILQSQLLDRAVSDSAAAANGVGSILDRWADPLEVVLKQVLVEESADQRKAIASTYLRGRDDYLAIQIFRVRKEEKESVVFDFTENQENVLFEKRNPDTVKERIKAHNSSKLDIILQSGRKYQIESLTHELRLPTVNLWRIFAVSGAEEQLVVVLSAWAAPLINSLRESEIIESFIVNRSGRVLVSRNAKEMATRKSYASYDLVADALRGRSSQGSEDGYEGDQRKWVGGYFALPKWGLVSVVQQDQEVAYQEIYNSIQSAALWGSLLIMLSILMSYFAANGLSKPLKKVVSATGEIAQGNFETSIPVKNRDEIGLLSHSVNIMAQKIRVLLLEQVAQAEVKKDLETAQMVQETLFPKPDRHQDILRVSGYSISASETGGDWWGHYSTGDGVEYVFIADAMGHGVPAALVTAVAYSSCMTLAHMLQDARQIYTPSQILQRVNRVLYEAVEGKISMTFFAMMVDYHKGEITFANAGHNLPILIPADPKDKRIKRRVKSLDKISPYAPISLSAKGTILGVESNAQFKEKSMRLKPGDKFFLFTDGLIECKSPDGGMWGRKVLLEKLMGFCEGSPEEIKTKVVNEAFSFFGDVPRDDDLTVVVVEFPVGAVVGGYRSDDKVVMDGQTKFFVAEPGGLDHKAVKDESSAPKETPKAPDPKIRVAEHPSEDENPQSLPFIPPPPEEEADLTVVAPSAPLELELPAVPNLEDEGSIPLKEEAPDEKASEESSNPEVLELPSLPSLEEEGTPSVAHEGPSVELSEAPSELPPLPLESDGMKEEESLESSGLIQEELTQVVTMPEAQELNLENPQLTLGEVSENDELPASLALDLGESKSEEEGGTEPSIPPPPLTDESLGDGGEFDLSKEGSFSLAQDFELPLSLDESEKDSMAMNDLADPSAALSADVELNLSEPLKEPLDSSEWNLSDEVNSEAPSIPLPPLPPLPSFDLTEDESQPQAEQKFDHKVPPPPTITLFDDETQDEPSFSLKSPWPLPGEEAIKESDLEASSIAAFEIDEVEELALEVEGHSPGIEQEVEDVLNEVDDEEEKASPQGLDSPPFPIDVDEGEKDEADEQDDDEDVIVLGDAS